MSSPEAPLIGTPMIEVRDVSKRFVKSLDLAARIAQRLGANVREEVVHAVDQVTVRITKGEVVGLVGESGCGKSTLGRMVAGIMAPSDGSILYKGDDLTDLSAKEARNAALQVQMIFQDPFASLNPRMRVENIIGEAPLFHGIVQKAEASDYLDQVMRRRRLRGQLGDTDGAVGRELLRPQPVRPDAGRRVWLRRRRMGAKHLFRSGPPLLVRGGGG